MAELVQTFLERMIPELEELQFLGLFTENETATILKRRRAFEYKLRKKKKNLNDYTRYIEYEQNVLSLIRMRRKKNGCRLKKESIEVAIIRRIHRLFGQAEKRFPRDIQIWLSHIEFAKIKHEKGSVGRVISKMLRSHNRQPELWIFAAKYEFEDNNDSETARKLFHRGIQFNYDSQLLWLEYYRMELLVAEKSRLRMEVLGQEAECKTKKTNSLCSIAMVVVRSACKAIPNDVSFILKFLPICRLFDFTEEHEDAIFDLLIDNYTQDELTWDAVARRKLHEATKTREKNSKLLPIHFKICLETFDSAVKSLPTALMYSLYLDFCLEQLKKNVNHNKAKTQLVQWALEVFEAAHEKNFLTADMFIKWHELLSNVGLVSEKALNVLHEATNQFSSDVRLWRLLLNHHSLGGHTNSKQVLKTFEEALKRVADKDALPLWDFVWNYCTTFSFTDGIEHLCERGLLHTQPKISSYMKLNYLVWIYCTEGIKPARAHYKKFHKTKPITQSFFEEYINMELSQVEINMQNIRSAYNDALEVFGTSDPDLWIRFMRLEIQHPQGKVDNLPTIYFKATKALEKNLLDEFVHKYTMFRTGRTTTTDNNDDN